MIKNDGKVFQLGKSILLNDVTHSNYVACRFAELYER